LSASRRSISLVGTRLAAVLASVVLLGAVQCGSGEQPGAGDGGKAAGTAAAPSRPASGGKSFVVGEYPPEATDEDKVTGTTTADGVLYAATASAYGYESTIVVRVTVLGTAERPVGSDAPIHSMEVVESYESPGWADGISEVREGEKRPWFQEQFTGKVLADLEVSPMDPDAGISAVTGATITSEGATLAAKRALQRIIDKTEEAYGAGEQ
jgi:hypothetical protein